MGNLRILDTSDGFSTSSSPTEGSISASSFRQYANVAAYVAAKGSAAADGDAFYDTTDDVVRCYVNSAWRILEAQVTTSKTANYTATGADSVILCSASGGAFTITLPAAASYAYKLFTVKKTDSSANAVTVDGNSSETVDGATTHVLYRQYESIGFISDGSNWHVAWGHRTTLNLVTSKTSSYTASAAEEIVKVDATGGAVTVTLPAAASHTGRVYTYKKTDSSANAVTLDGNSSETIDGATTRTLNVQYEAVSIVSDGSNWFILDTANRARNVVSKTTTYTATIDDDVILVSTSGGAWTLTLPAAASHKGRALIVKKTTSDSSALTIDGNASETIDGSTTASLIYQYDAITILSDGSNWHTVNRVVAEKVVTGTQTATNWPALSGEYGDLTSVSLTPGVWDLSAAVTLINSTTPTAAFCRIDFGTTSGNNGGNVSGVIELCFYNPGTASARFSGTLAVGRVAPSSTTTYYFKGRYEASGSNLQYQAYMIARRIS